MATSVLITYGYKLDYYLISVELEEIPIVYTGMGQISHHNTKCVCFFQQRKSTRNQLAALNFDNLFN